MMGHSDINKYKPTMHQILPDHLFSSHPNYSCLLFITYSKSFCQVLYMFKKVLQLGSSMCDMSSDIENDFSFIIIDLVRMA